MQLIRDLGITNGNEGAVGYYVGMMVSGNRVGLRVLGMLTAVAPQQSIFFLAQACTILHWSRLSDTIGRKPVILTGLFGISLSMYCFGLSRTFLALVLRCVWLTAAPNTGIGSHLKIPPAEA